MKQFQAIWPLAGAAVVALAMVVVVYLVRTTPDTAPSNPPDRGQTEEQAPAGPADRSALPGSQNTTP